MPDRLCPCQSGELYLRCCELYHQGVTAPSPEALMRSRYSAFVLGLSAYIQESWHVDTRPVASSAALALDAQGALAQPWKRLQIFSSGADGDRGHVHFCASCHEDGSWYELEEQSRFRREGDRWYYFDGDVVHRKITLGRNDPCPCGSGRKVKKCCAQ